MPLFKKHDPRSTNPLARFWNKVSIPDHGDKCWEWTQGITKQGYGRFWINGRQESAHRFSWRSTRGYIPDGLLVCHSCDNPRCVNPYHLFLGNHQINYRDAMSKGRINFAFGERSGIAKLKEAEVLEIRRLHKTGKFSCRKLASMFGVSSSNIGQIILRSTWKHI